MSVRVFSLVFVMFLVLVSLSLVFPAFAVVGESEAASALVSAEQSVSLGYQAVLNAENAGGNVSGLFVRLNDAGNLLAAARMSYGNGDFDTAKLLAGLGENIGKGVQNDAVGLKDSALSEDSRRTLLTTVASVAGVAVIALGSFVVWHRLRKKYGEYRGWFIVGSLILMLLAVIPVSALYIHLPSSSESFSELWLLGPNHMAEGYPFNVTADEKCSVYVGVGNRLGYSAYYKIFVKFLNETQPFPVASNSTPSSLSELYEFDFFVPENQVWEEMLNFTFVNVGHSNDSVTVGSLLINDVAFTVNGTTLWNVERKGFYYQLFFELWLYNTTSQSFQYHNRFVGLWLNMTAP